MGNIIYLILRECSFQISEIQSQGIQATDNQNQMSKMMFNNTLNQENRFQAMVDTFQELNQKMSTVKLMEKLPSHQELKLSQEESNKNHTLNTIPVSEANSSTTP